MITTVKYGYTLFDFNVMNVFCICLVWLQIDMLHERMEDLYFKIIDTHIAFRSCGTNLVPPKPKASFRHLK